MTKLTMGPILYNWTPEQKRDFYYRVADEAAVDIVYVGEVVCSKRESFFAPFLEDIHARLEAGGKEVVVEVEMENEFLPGTPLMNVSGDSGSQPSVLITAHYDSVFNGVGAHDNASGVVALLDLAARYRDLSRDVRFVAFDGEELNKVGAYKYVEHLKSTGSLNGIRLVINLDSVGIGEKLYVLTSPQLLESVKAILASSGTDVVSREAFKQFDSWPFMKEGIPVVQIGGTFTERDKAFPYFNSPKDTVGGNGFDLRSEMIAAAVQTASAIASRT